MKTTKYAPKITRSHLSINSAVPFVSSLVIILVRRATLMAQYTPLENSDLLNVLEYTALVILIQKMNKKEKNNRTIKYMIAMRSSMYMVNLSKIWQ